jgi:hypothetical protein
MKLSVIIQAFNEKHTIEDMIPFPILAEITAPEKNRMEERRGRHIPYFPIHVFQITEDRTEGAALVIYCTAGSYKFLRMPLENNWPYG